MFGTYKMTLDRGLSTYYKNGFAICELNHRTDEFKTFVDMCEDDQHFYYGEMANNFEMNDRNFNIVSI